MVFSLDTHMALYFLVFFSYPCFISFFQKAASWKVIFSNLAVIGGFRVASFLFICHNYCFYGQLFAALD